jgi:outer membrane protein OmpA-like peptidoglycan-associated protein/tetratricopeptide (TPR) repeat protein
LDFKKQTMEKSKYIFSLVLLFTIYIQGQAQPFKETRPEYSFQVAESAFEQKDYYNALEWYEKYYEATKDRTVAFKIAELHRLLNDYAKAETWYTRSLQRDKKATGDVNVEAKFYQAQMMKMNEKYDDAILIFDDYIKEGKDDIKIILAKKELEGAKMAMRMKENLSMTVANAGTKINSPNNEYSPSVTRDGSTLYFTGFRSDKPIKLDASAGDYYSKVMMTQLNPRGVWSDPQPVDGDINRAGANQGSVYLSPDSRVMYFTRIELSGNEVNKSTLYYSIKQGDSWSTNNEVKGINGNYVIKHPCIGDLYGKEVLIFASNMEGSKGGFDLFYANKISDGEFDVPKNLGDVINTVGDEETPFYKDGKLSFSSNGHPGIGGFDNFTSAWNGTSWSTPENMGKGLNTSVNDRYFNTDDDGNIYLVSNRPGGRSLKSKTCCEDIYMVRKEPIKVDLIATCTDGKKALTGIAYRFMEIAGGKPGAADEQTSDSYRADLGLNKAYMLIANKPGYYPDTVQFNTVGLKQTTTIEKKITLKPLPIITASLKATAQSGGKPLSGVTYYLADLTSKKVENKTGDMYTSALQLKKSYAIIGAKQGFIADTAYFNTNDITETTTIEKLLNLRPRTIIVKRNEPIKLQNIYYKLDKFAANEAEMEDFALAKQSLDYLFNIMNKYPDIVIELSSHTDSRGSDNYNLELSQKRAEGVKKYLKEKSIDGGRIVARGYGETRLVNQCKNGVKCSEEEHLQNRRTEFKIVSGPTTIEIEEQQMNR